MLFTPACDTPGRSNGVVTDGMNLVMSAITNFRFHNLGIFVFPKFATMKLLMGLKKTKQTVF